MVRKSKDHNQQNPRGCLHPFEVVHGLMRHGQYQNALHLLYDVKAGQLRQRFRFNPNHSWYLVGDIFSKQKQFRLAALAFRKTAFMRADDDQALFALGCMLSQTRQHELAIAAYQRSLAIQPNERAIYNLANAFFDTQQYEKALALYAQIQGDADLARMANRNAEMTQARSFII